MGDRLQIQILPLIPRLTDVIGWEWSHARRTAKSGGRLIGRKRVSFDCFGIGTEENATEAQVSVLHLQRSLGKTLSVNLSIRP
jgi:hypothetical protein